MLVVSIIIFLLLSALFSGSEIAFISASKLRVELSKQKGSRQGTILARFFEKPADFLGTMLVGNNIALVIFTSLLAKLLGDVFFQSLGIDNDILELFLQTVVATIIILIFGEFLPKTLFRLYANEILYFLAIPLRFLEFLLFVPAWLMTRLSNWLLRVIFKTPVEQTENVITRLDLENFIKDTRMESEDEIDTELFERALHLRNTRVKECMVPRTEINHIDVSASIEDLKQLFRDTKMSRIIITRDDVDDILGYVHHLNMLNEPETIEKAILDIPFVPEAMRVRDLMNIFIRDSINIACVVDEYGGTAGIITLEDILEEIFGEIEDEYDQEEYVETKLSEDEFIFSGRLEIDYLNEKYEELSFPEGEYSTLSGYLVMTTARIPEQGAEIVLDGYKFVLELVSDTKIETVRVIKLAETDEKMAD
ncbi:MAG: hemolysin family protein [Bacteroidota bacterium]